MLESKKDDSTDAVTALLELENNFLRLSKSGLYDNAPGDAPLTATNFFGFGLNSGTLRYQVGHTYNTHKFYSGTTLGYTISNTGGVNISDIRFKSDIQNITNGLDKIKHVQGKTFYLNGDTSKRQIGLIA